MANIRMYPTKARDWQEAEVVTGWCVEVAGTDACGEFHSGTNKENKDNAELFVRALCEQQARNREEREAAANLAWEAARVAARTVGVDSAYYALTGQCIAQVPQCSPTCVPEQDIHWEECIKAVHGWQAGHEAESTR